MFMNGRNEVLPHGFFLLDAPAGRLTGSRLAHALALGLCSLCCVSPALSDASDSSLGDEITLGEITVTAEKRSSNLQDTAISISALTSERLENSGIESTHDIQNAAPGVIWGSWGGFGQLYIRGIGNENISVAADPSSAFYVDDVYIARANAAVQEFGDLDRIEIVKGPQGTLQGRNSVGGSINLYTKLPDLSGFGAEADLTYANLDKLRFRGAMNLPLIEGKLASRISLVAGQRDGYVTNRSTAPVNVDTPSLPTSGADSRDYGNEDFLGARIKTLYEPTDDLEVLFGLEASRDRGSRSTTLRAITDLPNPAIDICFGPLFPCPETDGNVGRTTGDPRENFLNFTPLEKLEHAATDLRVTWDLGRASLKSVSAYRYFKQDTFFDVDSTDTDEAKERLLSTSETVQQEFDLTSNLAGPWTWVLGAFYFHEDTRQDIPVSLRQGTLLLDFDVDLVTDAWAVFGQTSYTLFEKLRLTAGVRYSEEKKDIAIDHLVSIVALGLNIPVATQGIETFDAVTPKVGIDYFLNDDVLLYFSVTNGFKSGGFNALIGDLAQISDGNFRFEPEDIVAYEVGAKTELFDKRVRVNVAGFHYDYTDIQVQLPVAGGAIVQNAASATVRGIETEITALVAGGLTAHVGAQYLDAKFDEFITTQPVADDPAQTVLNLKGNTLPRSPKRTLYANLNYEHDVGDAGGKLTWIAEAAYKSRVFHEQFNLLELSQEAFTLVNARITFQAAHGRYTVSAWGKNLTDKEWFNTSLRGTDFGGAFRVLDLPRTYGLTVGMNF